MTEKQLSKSCYNLWMTIHWVTIGIITLVGLIPWVVTLVIEPLHLLLIIPAAIPLIGLIIYCYIKGYWKRFRFAFDEDQLRIYLGIWWQKQVLIPFSRITNIDIVQGPWQRKRSLATLKIQTAGKGATSIAEALIYSQEEFEYLRENLLSRVLKSKSRFTGDGTGDAGESGEDNQPWDRMIELLKRIEENTRSIDN